MELVDIQLRIYDHAYAGAPHDVTVRNLIPHGRISDPVALSGTRTKPCGAGGRELRDYLRARRCPRGRRPHRCGRHHQRPHVGGRWADDVTISNSTISYSRPYADINSSIRWDWDFGLQPSASGRLRSSSARMLRTATPSSGTFT